MCGITGIFSIIPTSHVSRDLLQRMTSTLSHRGPDEGTVYVDGQVGLGHRRLSIIDVASGTQPIFNEDRTKAIVFNGEIYNFTPLRDELAKRGHRFTTHSDTETILHAYEEYGRDCVNHLRGMFAFVIWDSKQKLLFAARDRLGIKPFYYAWDGKTFLFASEIKAILEHPGASKALDPFAVDEYLTYLYVPAPRTIFQGIKKLRPGYTLTVSARGLEEHEYWDLTFAPQEQVSEKEWREGLREQLREAVASHLMSEVPLGAFLSGGVDSSAVVATMAELDERPVTTASIGFRQAAFDEITYARAVGERFHTRAHEKIIDANAAHILDTLSWHFDEPFADSSMVPTYYVSQVAREHVTVCLSGDGGDENFAGYRRYRFDVAENKIRGLLPRSLREPMFHFLGSVYPKADWLPRIFRAKTLFTNLSLSPERAYFHTMSCFTPAMKRGLYTSALQKELGDYDPFVVMSPYFERSKGWDPLSRIQYVDIKTYLVDDILTKVDRASMAHSLEVRVPLLDHKMVEYAASIPVRYKLQKGEGKAIFKKMLEDLLPREILYRPKMGFSIPLAQWFRHDLKGVFEERVLAPGAFLHDLMHPQAIRSWWDQHLRGVRDYSTHLWALLMLECWGEKFLHATNGKRAAA